MYINLTYIISHIYIGRETGKDYRELKLSEIKLNFLQYQKFIYLRVSVIASSRSGVWYIRSKMSNNCTFHFDSCNYRTNNGWIFNQPMVEYHLKRTNIFVNMRNWDNLETSDFNFLRALSPTLPFSQVDTRNTRIAPEVMIAVAFPGKRATWKNVSRCARVMSRNN